MSDGVEHHTIETNGITMHLATAGAPPDDKDAPLIVLCHGFPELWYSWRYQLPALAAEGYAVVAPDQRGFGKTDRPEPIDDYDIVHLTDDMAGLLDTFGREKAIFVGHDWGSVVVWNMAQRLPERVEAVCGMSVAFTQRGQMSTTALLRNVMGDRFFYMLYFQEPGVADADMGKDPREAMRRFLSAIGAQPAGGQGLIPSLPAEGTTFWDWVPPVETLPPWLSEEALDVFATEFERTGFTGGINWYRNFDRNWQINEPWGTRKVEMPAGFIAGREDPVLVMTPPERMEGWVTDLRVSEVIDGAGHWVQQEKPDETNEALLRFLRTLR